MTSRVCIVATVREPVAIIESFIRYHLAIGVEHIFLFFDDPLDEAIEVARQFEQVTAIPSDDALRERQRGLRSYPGVAKFAHEVMARQILNVETAIELAWKMRLDWIIHIDGDELFYGPMPVSQFFDCVPHAIGQISFRNFEGVPETWNVANYFREVTLFKRHDHLLPPSWPHEYRLFHSRENYLLGYGNGKSAARVTADLQPSGVHCFSTTIAHPQRIDCPGSPVILHYINCGFEAYLRKYQRLSSDSWLGLPIPFKFYLDSRRLTGNIPALTDLYQHEVLFDAPDEKEYLLGKRILTRITLPSELLDGNLVNAVE